MQRRRPSFAPLAALAAAGPLALAGCNSSQSALAPRGPHAGAVDTLTWLVFAGGTLIFLAVMLLLVAAILLRRDLTAWMTGNAFIIGFGIVFPVVTLTSLLTFSAFSSRALVTPAPRLRIEVVGEQFWWRVHYLDARGAATLVTANEIRIPVDTPVEFILKAQDVIHSFWVPNLAGKLDMIPGRVNSYVFAASEPGVYRGQCAEYCGAQHALMAFHVVAAPQAEFSAWLAQQTGDAIEPATPFLARGRQLFLDAGCGACHVIRGTPADGLLGPDLTRVGSRLSLAAGTFPVNIGTLAGWTSSAQHLKPGNLMPSFGNLRGAELRAIAAYLESLK
ncbi:MAG: cytochrome c oxidase subunit II [Hyphomicrobiaceae bacterium]|nr:cytochrome c oxidase subunit II [Hyphomicrobiaceae bacterium]